MLGGEGEAGVRVFYPLEAQEGILTTILQTSCTNSLAAKTKVKAIVPQAEETSKKEKPRNMKRLQALLSWWRRGVYHPAG